jgi:type II restriction/modification system DNA methylase subunit YeeA
MPPLTLPEFVAQWQKSTLTERAGSQSHFNGLCDILGEPKPESDTEGTSYTFERGASKIDGGEGWADVWRRGYFGWEYKGKRKNLDEAYKQLLQYREDLENPPILVTCDLDRFEVHTNFTNTAPQVFKFDLAGLVKNEPTSDCPRKPIEVLRLVFNDPGKLKPGLTTEQVTEAAAAQFSELARSLRDRGVDPEKGAHFLMRLLFCLFSEDIGLLPSKLFSRLVNSSLARPADFEKKLKQLFAAMSAPNGSFGADDIAYFNGGLFSDDQTYPLSADDLAILSKAAALDWAHVEPAIFGTLFERSLDPSKRSQLGAHYTSRDDILLIVEPVVMAPLRRRWEEVKQEAEAVAAKIKGSTGAARTKHTQKLRRFLMGFADEVSSTTVLDPACGSGNFLYVALKSLLDLEKQVSTFAAGNGLSGLIPKTDPSRLFGIETNVYAHELASVVVWIGYIQWQHDNGFNFGSSPILKPLTNIRRMDAVLGYEAVDDSARSSVPAATLDREQPSRAAAKDIQVTGRLESAGFPGISRAAAKDIQVTGRPESAGFPGISRAAAKDIQVTGRPESAGFPGISRAAAKDIQVTGRPESAGFPGISRAAAKQLLAQRGSAGSATTASVEPALAGDTIPVLKPVEPEWPKADCIIGNPPFLGDKKMRDGLGDKYVDDLRSLYDQRVPGGADFVTYWFERARAEIEGSKARRAGLLATNSISMMGNRPVVDRIKKTGEIFVAWSDRPWILDGASVRVSIIGFDNGDEANRVLDGQLVKEINSDLTAGADASSALSLAENSGLCFLGVMKGGPFDIEEAEAARMLSAPINPNGHSNTDVVKRRIVGADVVQRTKEGWIIDFGTMALSESALYEMPFEYVRNVVKPTRDASRDKLMRTNWWLHGRSRPALRSAIASLGRCIVTPEVAKYRIFVWLDTRIVPDHTLHVIARADDYFLGILHSRIHELWSLSQGSWMGVGNDPRYSSSRTFETFPFPWPPGKEPQDDPRVKAIAAAAKELVEKRDAWLNPPGATEAELKKRTLTNLYNQRPQWLDNLHKTLDAAVFAAYGWPTTLTDAEILERLLALNHERAKSQGESKKAASSA